MHHSADTLPIIDVAPLLQDGAAIDTVATAIAHACRTYGFFYIRGHGIDPALIKKLDTLSREFFAQAPAWKSQWPMTAGGRAWRGYFHVGDELTSSRPDLKEGLYFGEELAADHPLVRAATPMHGSNLFPDIPEMRQTVLAYMNALTRLGHNLARGISASLGLPQDYLARMYTADPLILFRIFNYPPVSTSTLQDSAWGVGEHTDYGLLTILYQDATGGLEVRTPQGWIEAPPVAGTFVCNIGDMLDFITGGLYRSTPHRVRQNATQRGRISLPFFFDPNFFAPIQRIEHLAGATAHDDSAQRWDKTNIHAFDGTYGEYLLNKVSKVFPQLKASALGSADDPA